MFVYCSGDHRDLHSFPTRRSSDLPEDMIAHKVTVEVLTESGKLEPRTRTLYETRYGPVVDSLLGLPDRKSTRLNSSHVAISYAVFCLKKKIRNKKNEFMRRSNNST